MVMIAIAIEAWSRLLHSNQIKITYAFSSGARDRSYSRRNISLSIYNLQLVQGMKHIQDCIRSIKKSDLNWCKEVKNKLSKEMGHIRNYKRLPKVPELVQAYERGLLEIEHSRDCMRSTKHCKESSKSGNQQGMEHIQGCMRSSERSEIVQANELGNQQGVEYIRPCMRSNERSEIVQANEHGNQQGIEHIRPCMRSNESDEVVRVNEHEIQLGIEHVQGCMRSTEPYEMVQENEYGYQQGMEYIRPRMRSNDEVVPGEYENHQQFNQKQLQQSSKELNFSGFGLDGISSTNVRNGNLGSNGCKPESGEILNFGESKISNVGDSIIYINELKSKLQASDSEKEQLTSQLESLKRKLASNESQSSVQYGTEKDYKVSNGKLIDLDIDVRIIGWWYAMIRIQSSKKNHPAARLMAALEDLDLDVIRASVSVVKDLMIQQATVMMGSRLYTQEQLRVALTARVS